MASRKKPFRRLVKIAIDNATIKELAEDSGTVQAAPFSIRLINSSNWIVEAVRRGDTGDVVPLPTPVGKNCSGSCQDCAAAGIFMPLFTVACNTKSFDVVLILRHPRGFRGASQPLSVSPTCDHEGQILCFAAPDPR
ncbi:hypothetical protein SAMN05444166_3928 [Singulisphaera sp. GP187]|nr:hypothetical protein SAMN05444166_3928 [Singulisphaera sp. GP187]